ncbi:MAG: hypothetical protein WD065_09045 [Planctomycetaceae bacterium]
MSKVLLCTVLGVSLPWLVGCGTAGGVVRGQTPTADIQALPAAHGGEVVHETAHGGEVVYAHGDACNYCGIHCGGTCNMCMGYGWRPHHKHTYLYKRPELAYPPSNGPTGTVVYPYYTVKGPDDFFME